MSTPRRRLAAPMAALAGAAAGAVALWFLVAAAFASDRALDFTDEGLYLLAAEPPSKTAAWVSPFGWSTAPFFRLVGHSIADFRTLGVWLAIIVGASLGWTVGRWLTADDITPWRRWCPAGLAVLGASGAPFYASSLLRTPGYNWVSLLGLAVGAIGALRAALVPALEPPWRRRDVHVAAALLAFGVCFAVPSKPTSAPFLLLGAAILVAPRWRSRTWSFAAMVAAWGAALVVLAVVAGAWPLGFVRTLWRSTQFPPLHPNQTIAGALKDVARTPKAAWQGLRQLRTATVTIVTLATLGAVCVRRLRRVPAWLRDAPLVAVVLAAVGTVVPWPLLGMPTPAFRFAWTGTANAAVLLAWAAALHLYVHWRSTDAAPRRRALQFAAVATVLAIAFSFGSAMGVFHQMGLASVLLWLGVAAVAVVCGRAVDRQVVLGVLVAAGLTMVVANTVDSRHHPFNDVDVARQVVPVRLGRHGTRLLLDADTADHLGRVVAAARHAGFCPGMPLIGMAWNWSSTIPYAIGARMPDELQLTLFGYANAPAVLDFTMPFLRGPMWHDAWVLTTDPASIEPAQAAELRAALDRLPGAVGRTFPADYTLAMDVDGTQLWRPAGVTAGCAR